MEGSTVPDDLQVWLAECYPQSVRTAYLILGNRLDAEDAVQESFLRAWKFRDSLSRESSFKPWLYRVVVNTCNSKLRHDIPRREGRVNDVNLVDIATNDDLPGRVALSNDVMCALRDLPVHLRVVVVLRYYADLSERDIAIAIARKQGTVKSRLNEARTRLALHPALRTDASRVPATSKEVNG
ncbi:MAG TPA: RNA polymerase sigma factor [Acidimicrobiales bacterium]|nr:RNA polymerase sigma factor [Acidimicrobiales bacterium]